MVSRRCRPCFISMAFVNVITFRDRKLRTPVTWVYVVSVVACLCFFGQTVAFSLIGTGSSLLVFCSLYFNREPKHVLQLFQFNVSFDESRLLLDAFVQTVLQCFKCLLLGREHSAVHLVHKSGKWLQMFTDISLCKFLSSGERQGFCIFGKCLKNISH